MRRALAAFPDPDVSRRLIDRYFIPEGKSPDRPFATKPMVGHKPNRELEELLTAANFSEVFLAKEGHGGMVGVNYLNKIQTPLLPSLYGAMLAGVDVEDTVHVMTRQTGAGESSILGSFSLNQHQPPNESRMTVLCEQGAVRVEGLRLLTCTEPNSDWTVEEEFHLERDDLFVAQASAFLDQLEGKAEAACTLDEALQTLRVNLAELRSLETQKWETPSV